MFEVKKAKRSRRPMKICLEGLSGSGKTFSALRLAFAMRRAGIGKKIVLADSENESGGLYDGVKQDGETWEYEVCPIPPSKQNPGGYADAYEYLIGQGFDIIIIDSMSHAWHGAMEMVDQIAARSGRNDKFQAWASVTPAQRRMFQLITDPRAHLIATMRVKSDYERVEGSNGKAQMRKVGLKADQREGSEYEFDCVVRLDTEEHAAIVEKVRGCTAMDGKHGKCPGPDFWKPLFDWWLMASPVEPPKQSTPPPAPKTPASIIKAIQDAKTQKDFDACLADARDNWRQFSEAQRTEFLQAKAAASTRFDRPDRRKLDHDISEAIAALEAATGRSAKDIHLDLTDEFGVGALADMSNEQMAAAIEWLGERMPKEAVA